MVRALLRSVWAEPRPAGAPARVWRDWVLVGAVIAATVAEGALRRELPLRALSVAVTVALGAALLYRRTRPLLAIAVVFAAIGLLTVITAGAIPQMYSGAYVLLFPYALLRWGSGREAVIGVAIVIVKVLLSVLPGVARTGNLALGAVVLFAMMALGAVFRLRANARLRELDRAKLLERERLARDLHDTVAHHVSAIAIRAQAGLALAAAAPDAPIEALRVIEAEASRTLAEMRAMVRVLRRDDQAVPAKATDVTGSGGLADRGDLADLRPSPSVADRERLRMILDAQPGLTVISVAADGEQAVEEAKRLRPDVCLLDIRMPVLDGIEATRLLAGPDVADPIAVVVITTFDLDEYVYAALKAGARGFLLKDAGPALLVQAITAAAAGDALIAPNITARLLDAFASAGPPAPPRQPLEPLTGREEQILATVAATASRSPSGPTRPTAPTESTAARPADRPTEFRPPRRCTAVRHAVMIGS
jgi:DNA-binding NarL/FixJ family response regulator